MKARLLTMREVGDRLHVGEKTIRRLIATGDLRAAQIGWQWRVDEDDVDAYLERQREKAVVVNPTEEAKPEQARPRTRATSVIPGADRYM